MLLPYIEKHLKERAGFMRAIANELENAER